MQLSFAWKSAMKVLEGHEIISSLEVRHEKCCKAEKVFHRLKKKSDNKMS